MSFKELALRPDPSPNALIFIPGWAFRGEILQLLNEDVGDVRIFYPDDLPWRVAKGEIVELLCQLKESYKKVFLAGWSLGALIVHTLVKELVGKVDCVVLISPRARYGFDEIRFLKGYLTKDKMACLRYFYRKCFKGQEGDYRRFKDLLEGRFIDSFSLEELLEGLDFLQRHPLRQIYVPEGLRCLLFQGKRDHVAPLDKAPPVVGKSQIGRVVVEGSGHLPFLKWKQLIEAIHG